MGDVEIRARMDELEAYSKQLERKQTTLDRRIANEPHNEELKAKRVLLTEIHMWLDVTFPFTDIAKNISGVIVFKDTSRTNVYYKPDLFFGWMKVRAMIAPVAAGQI